MRNFSEFNASLLHDAYERISDSTSSRRRIIRTLKPVSHASYVTGPAFTMRLTRVAADQAPGRQTIMSSYDNVPANAVLVIQVVGDPGGGVVGDLVAHRLSAIGIHGVIVDGPVRDVKGILSYELPVWSRELSISGMAANELMLETGCELTIDGVPLAPGDLVSADVDGIFVVPKDEVDETLESAEKLVQEETVAHQRLATGVSILESYPNIRSTGK